MYYLYSILPAIYNGEKTGIRVALQDNLLLANYEYGQLYREETKRLGALLDLLSHQKSVLKSWKSELAPEVRPKIFFQHCKATVHGGSMSNIDLLIPQRRSWLGQRRNFPVWRHDLRGFRHGEPATNQGYEPEWDLVVASNVIHATSDIKGALQTLRSALKPGVKMVLLEITQSQLGAGLAYGTFSDFWKGDLNKDFPRFDGPFLSKEMWRSVLPQAGFSGLDFHLDDYAGSNVSTTVICATAVEQQLSVPLSLVAEPSALTLVSLSFAS